MSNATVRAVLFGDSDVGAALAPTQGWRGVVQGLQPVLSALSGGGPQAVERELSTTLADLLALDLGELLVAGWRRHRALVEAARATQASPTATEVVQLAQHRITTGHRPYVDVVVNGARVASIQFDLSLAFDVDEVVGVVREARLVAVRGGRCTVTAGLGCQGRELASRQVVLDPEATVSLGQGVPLLPPN